MTWEDRLADEARHSPAAGKPLPGLDDPRDDQWWVKQWIRREGLGVTPPTIAVRLELERVLAEVQTMKDEAQVRAAIEALNGRIREVNRTASTGPPSSLMPYDVDELVERWRSRSGR